MNNTTSELCCKCGQDIVYDEQRGEIIKSCRCAQTIWNRSMRDKLDEFLREVEREKNKHGLLQNRKGRLE